MSRDDDSDDRPSIRISPRALTEVALQFEREADAAVAERIRRMRAPTEPGSNPSEEEQRLRNVEDSLLVLSGKDGNNGRVGNIRKDVDGIRSFLKYLAMGVAGSMLTAAGAVYSAGHKDGAGERESEYLRTEVARLRDEVRDLRAMPALRLPSWMAPTGDNK